MRTRQNILAEQSIWLKLIILVIAFSLGFDASFRQLIWVSGIFLLYFLIDPEIYIKLWFALRKILPFLTGYWVFATLFGVLFPDMLLFSLQIIYFLLITVYTLGTVDIEHFIQDTRRIQRYKLVEKLIYLILATSLFIRNYFTLLGERKPNRGDSISGVMASFALLVKENYAQALAVEEQIQTSFEQTHQGRDLLSFPNLVAICFLTVLVLVGAM